MKLYEEMMKGVSAPRFDEIWNDSKTFVTELCDAWGKYGSQKELAELIGVDPTVFSNVKKEGSNRKLPRGVMMDFARKKFFDVKTKHGEEEKVFVVFAESETEAVESHKNVVEAKLKEL